MCVCVCAREIFLKSITSEFINKKKNDKMVTYKNFYEALNEVIPVSFLLVEVLSNLFSWYEMEWWNYIYLNTVWSNPLLTSLPIPLWTGVVAPDMVLSMGQIEGFHI